MATINYKYEYLNRGRIGPRNMNIQYGRHNREIEYLNRGDIGPGIMNIQYGRHNLENVFTKWWPYPRNMII